MAWRCPQCTYDNGDGATACGASSGGDQAAAACPACTLVNDAGATACAACGQALGAASAPEPARAVVADVSQYSFPNGRSACSFIALRAAQIAAGPDLLTAEQIGRAVRQGVQDHQESMQRGLLQVEHASVDEALHARNAAAGTDATPVPVLHEAFGLTSTDNAFQDALGEAFGAAPDSDVAAVIVTKTPETVTVLRGPAGEGGPPAFAVVDSHPRPGLEGAHMLVYPSLDAAAARLHEVFPSLGGSDEAATMYNAFNATAIGREGSARGEPRALGEGGAAGEA